MPSHRRVKLPYVLNRTDKPGYYFNRRVPKDVMRVVGKGWWRWKLGDTLPEARRNLPEAIAQTDRLTFQIRAGKSLEVAQASSQRLGTEIPIELDRQLLQGQPAREIYQDDRFYGTPEQALQISELPPVSVLSSAPVSPDDLISLSLKLKPQTSLATQDCWVRHLKEFTDFLGHTNLHLVQRSDCRDFRDYLLTKLKPSTTKTRLGYVTGLFNLGCEDEVFSSNPFAGVAKRLGSIGNGDGIERKEYDVSSADEQVDDVLPQLDADLYWCLRWTGCRIAEMAGIKSQDIDFDKELIHITPYIDPEVDKDLPRPLKNKHSKRVVPIHPKLIPILKRLTKNSDRPFAEFYRPKDKRWRSHIVWSTKIGLNPHALRHNFTTTLRNKGIDDYVIGRLAGHQISGMTANYGTISVERLREALLKLD